MAAKVCIVGCGALGSVFAARIWHASLISRFMRTTRPKTIAINQSGLQISGAAKFTVRLHATFDPHQIPGCDFGIFATKSPHTRTAIEQTAHIFRDSGVVCWVQNGLGNEEIIAEQVQYVIRGATPMAAHLITHGHAGFEFYSDMWIGPFEPSETPHKSVEQLAAILTRAGLQVVCLQDARGWQWSKLIFNSAVNPVGALTQPQRASRPQTLEALLQEGRIGGARIGD